MISHHTLGLRRLVTVFLLLGLALTGVSFTSSGAWAAPSKDEVNRAKAKEEDARKSVAEIESELAGVNSELNNAFLAAQKAGAELEEALMQEKEAKEEAEQAKADAQEAKEEVARAREQVGKVATAVYRSGTGTLSEVTPYLAADGLQSVAMRKLAVEMFGAQADSQMQSFTAVQEVAKVLQKKAEEAAERATAARQVVEEKKRLLDAEVERVKEIQARVESRREELVAELARRRGVTVKLEKEYRQEQERLERERQRKAAEERARQLAEQQRLQQQQQAAAPSYSAPAPSGGSGYSSSRGAAVVAFARSMIGVPYVWGGESWGGVDCSGLAMLAYQNVGIYMPHWARSQYWQGTHIPLNQMAPGDMIFWQSGGVIVHVAIYTGNGMMVEAPYPGAYVWEVPVRWGGIMPYATRP